MIKKRLTAVFYRKSGGKEPVRDWLRSLPVADRREIGGDIKAVEYGWPLGLPLCRPLTGHKGLWEVRSSIGGGKIARVIFTIADSRMVLLHGFQKTSQKTPKKEIDIAVRRMKGLK